MGLLSPTKFVNKWSKVSLNEIKAAQSHLNDVCSLVGHPTPVEADPKGEFFTFEEPTKKLNGKSGRADVWFKGKFIWEYKGNHANLDKAYEQLLLYRESLGNPPLLITSDMHKIIIHTNFTDTIKEIYTLELNDLLKTDNVSLLKRIFCEPLTFKPEKTQEQVTQTTANTFIHAAEILQKLAKYEGKPINPERLAHFIVRLLFSLFAEDMGLLPNNLFSRVVEYGESGFPDFDKRLSKLFSVMRKGGKYGIYKIPYFNGNLFDDDFVPEMPSDIDMALKGACELDWSNVDPSIFGTLFERVIDESKRSQLGAHYTSKDDIMLLIEPVLMEPLREEWNDIKRKANKLIGAEDKPKACKLLKSFSDKISSVKVLDPACGSGNFLYIALRQLLDLQKSIIAFSGWHGLGKMPLTINPGQLYGIEINPYAHELAQITVWIGYIQWRFENGFQEIKEPILQPLQNIKLMDAVIKYDKRGRISEPNWAEVNVIIGNPPFIGNKKMRKELGDEYVDDLHKLYEGRIPGGSDFVCYWFERARKQIKSGKAKRAGLLATQAIRGGANRKVLEKIKADGDLFFGVSDRIWYQEGVSVHVSMVGFDNGSEIRKKLDGKDVDYINPNLTSGLDLTIAKRLKENERVAFMGDTKVGPFNIDNNMAQKMLADKSNQKGYSNKDVVRPWINARDIMGKPSNKWIIDFGIDKTEKEASQYKMPYKYIKENVKPFRVKARSGDRTGVRWWIHQRPRPDLREAIEELSRYIVTPRVSKYRVFVWKDKIVIPDSATIAFAREDDYFFGVLHSKVHELWARRMGTQLREAKSGFRYTPTSTFKTFPFPFPLGSKTTKANKEEISSIANLARELLNFRDSWLYPPSKDIDITISKTAVMKRTYTVLYNALDYYRQSVRGKERSDRQWNKAVKNLISLEEIEELDNIHNKLDEGVVNAYGWQRGLNEEELLRKLLKLNLERHKKG